MKSIYKIGLAALSVAAVMSSCIKETLPTSVASNEQVNSNPTALESMVNGMAAFVNKFNVLGRPVDDEYHFDFGYPAMGIIRDVMCDNYSTMPSDYNVWFAVWFENDALGEDYVYGQFIWNYYTQFLQTANAVIGAVEEESASEQQKAYLAMAYCYRSLINLDMGRMYEFKPNNYTSKPEVEGLTIPIIREDMTEEEASNNPRATKEELAAFIEKDLDKAIELFGGDFTRSSVTEPDLSVAYGLKARLYMWTEEYDKAKSAAEAALAAGNYTPVTEDEWTNPATGFNTATKAWMWASTTVKEDDVVQTGIINFISWTASETIFTYVAAGPTRLAASGFYDKIADTDFRKKSWKAPEGSTLDIPYIAATSDYPGADELPDLAVVKFRPGSGDPDNYDIACSVDYPLMRMEEMEFIKAECDARNGNSATLINFIKNFRNPQYTTNASGDALIEEVFLQKQIEFWGEGIIFFDYKRLNHSITRGYEGTNYYTEALMNTNGLAPWMNFCIVRTEKNSNRALEGYENPDPSGTVPLWTGK